MTVKVSEAEPPAFSLILARHASTEASEARRLLGALDEPLSKRGTQEAADLAHAIAARLDRAGLASADGRVLTSPLTRAVQTASVIAKALGWRMDVRDDFRERDFGTWAGRSIDELSRSAPIVAAQFVTDPLSVLTLHLVESLRQSYSCSLYRPNTSCSRRQFQGWAP